MQNNGDKPSFPSDPLELARQRKELLDELNAYLLLRDGPQRHWNDPLVRGRCAQILEIDRLLGIVDVNKKIEIDSRPIWHQGMRELCTIAISGIRLYSEYRHRETPQSKKREIAQYFRSFGMHLAQVVDNIAYFGEVGEEGDIESHSSIYQHQTAHCDSCTSGYVIRDNNKLLSSLSFDETPIAGIVFIDTINTLNPTNLEVATSFAVGVNGPTGGLYLLFFFDNTSANILRMRYLPRQLDAILRETIYDSSVDRPEME